MAKAYQIIFENEHFIVVDKASGVLSVPGRVENDDLILGRLLEVDLNQTILPVHRLDFEVSGLIMYAKTKEAHRAGNAWFNDKLIYKTYSALTSGEASGFEINKTYDWTCLLLRGKKRAYESPHGKKSLTKATFLGSKLDYYLWDLSPITGRSHQLRYELYRHGHSIVGDKLYGSPFTFRGQEDSIALRAFKINLSQCSDALSFGLPLELEISSFKNQ